MALKRVQRMGGRGRGGERERERERERMRASRGLGTDRKQERPHDDQLRSGHPSIKRRKTNPLLATLERGES